MQKTMVDLLWDPAPRRKIKYFTESFVKLTRGRRRRRKGGVKHCFCLMRIENYYDNGSKT